MGRIECLLCYFSKQKLFSVTIEQLVITKLLYFPKSLEKGGEGKEKKRRKTSLDQWERYI